MVFRLVEEIFDNWLKIPVDVGNLIETQYTVSISLLGAPSETIDFCLKHAT